MARLVVLANPLDPSRRRTHALDPGTLLGEWLDAHEPTPAGCTREVWVDGRQLGAEPYHVGTDDEVLVSFRPAYVAGAYIVGYIVQALIAIAIGYALNRLFGPSKPKSGNTPSPSQVYGIAPTRNAARLGEPIPVLYGSVIALPDYSAQPYVEYVGNEQYLRALLCLGQGEFVVHEMLCGDSGATPLPADVASYQIFGPADHGSTFGVIQAATGVRENVVTSADVSDQELLAPNQASNTIPTTWYWKLVADSNGATPPPGAVDVSAAMNWYEMLLLLPPMPAIGSESYGIYRIDYEEGTGTPVLYWWWTWVAEPYTPGLAIPGGSLVPPPGFDTINVTKWVGPFETCKAGQAGTSVELDFTFPGGLYTMDSAGNIFQWRVFVTVEITPIDDAGNPSGPTVATVEEFLAGSNTAQRFTRVIPKPLGRYRVRCARTSAVDGRVNTSDRTYWSGLKFELQHVGSAPVYGNVTLAAVKLRATNGIASDAASSIRFRVTRKLPPVSGGAAIATVNPADVFADIVTAAYGGNRPRNADELDLVALNEARVRWAGHNGFNAVFDQPSTVWEALTLSVQTVSAAPMPIGSRFSIVQDGVQPVRSQMFTDKNIVRGTLQVTHSFDRDGTPAGVRVEYRDPRTFTAAAYFLPPNAPDYESANLFGCTDGAVAAEYAQLMANRRQLQRTAITFSTELEGLSCLPGDRIGVQSKMVRWAQSAAVVAVSGLVLTLDVDLVWTPGETHAILLRDPQGKAHSVHGVTRGATDHHVVMPSLPFPPVTRVDGMEPTFISFGIEGQEITDWTVNTMQPQGERVTIHAVNYDPELWAGAGAHLAHLLPFEEASR